MRVVFRGLVSQLLSVLDLSLLEDLHCQSPVAELGFGDRCQAARWQMAGRWAAAAVLPFDAGELGDLGCEKSSNVGVHDSH